MDSKVEKINLMAEHVVKAEVMSLNIERYYTLTSDGAVNLFWTLRLGYMELSELVESSKELLKAVYDDVNRLVSEEREIEIYASAENNTMVIYGMTAVFVSEINKEMNIPLVLNLVEGMGFKVKEQQV